MAGKIKHYQDDNLRLSNEVVKLSNKLENTKFQLKQFENNKSKLMNQLEGLSNIISENNIIDSAFNPSQTVLKDENKKSKEIISDDKDIEKVTQKQFLKIKESSNMPDPKEMDIFTKEIFKK